MNDKDNEEVPEEVVARLRDLLSCITIDDDEGGVWQIDVSSIQLIKVEGK